MNELFYDTRYEENGLLLHHRQYVPSTHARAYTHARTYTKQTTDQIGICSCSVLFRLTMALFVSRCPGWSNLATQRRAERLLNRFFQFLSSSSKHISVLKSEASPISRSQGVLRCEAMRKNRPEREEHAAEKRF